jgi:hypothetical protein
MSLRGRNRSFPRGDWPLAAAAAGAALFWLGLVALGVKLGARFFPAASPSYTAALFALVIIVAYAATFLRRAAQVAWLHGHAVEVGADQHPDLATHVKNAARRLADAHARERAAHGRLPAGAFERLPRVFLFHDPAREPGFGATLLGEQYLALNAAALDALAERPGAIDFHIGVALAELHDPQRHWRGLLLPARVLPLIGPALGRAETYRRDRTGLAACKAPVDAAFALAVLANGARRGKTLRIAEFVRQGETAGGFWLSLMALGASHPWPARRLARLRALATSGQTTATPYHALAWLVALAVPALGTSARAIAARMLLLMLWVAIAIHAGLGAQRLLAERGIIEVTETRLDNKPLRLPAAGEAPASAAPAPAPATDAEPYARLNDDLRLIGEAAAKRSQQQGTIVCEIDGLRNSRELNFPPGRYALSCNEPVVYTVVEDSEFEPGRPSFLHSYHWRDKRLLTPSMPPAPGGKAASGESAAPGEGG